MTHKQLVDMAYKWVLKSAGCGVAFKELNTHACNGEYPDVIGFQSHGVSVLVEAKASRSDFLSDKKKHFRQHPELGMGTYRYYCCPAGLIKKEELPDKWGLLYVYSEKRIVCIYNPRWTKDNSFEKNMKAEHGLMYSALRRLFIKGHIKSIYDKQYNRSTTANELIALNSINEPNEKEADQAAMLL